MNAFDLTGRRALVTGASRGIGAAIALGLAEAGADVVLVARDQDALDRSAARVTETGRGATTIACDVTDADSVAARLGDVGDVDILVNNVGGFDCVGPFLELTPRDWNAGFSRTLDSAVNMLRAVGPALIARGDGRVVNIASVSGLAGVPMVGHYAASKAALISLTRTLAVEWSAHGVRVNAIAPGWIRTELTQAFHGAPQVSDVLLSDVPQNDWGTPEDVAGAVVYLASDAARMVTGACLTADGGLLAQPGGPALRNLLHLGRIELP
ncbi:SDR family NAD(P)-dependent oxidoreductase [Stackebrandtia soli]|uniref:SDR family NAD(P)-dependent oxidoreductase n=1 Tax=Stackebrandtia soli TaxID=1892856 RepID=UPI0039E7674E